MAKKFKQTDLEGLFLQHWKRLAADQPHPTHGGQAKQLLPVAGRRWRADYAWEQERLIVELHGAVQAGGRHTRGKGFIEDRHKMNMCELNGWMVLEFTTEMLKENPEMVVAQVSAVLIHRQKLRRVLEPVGLWGAMAYGAACQPPLPKRKRNRKAEQARQQKKEEAANVVLKAIRQRQQRKPSKAA